MEQALPWQELKPGKKRRGAGQIEGASSNGEQKSGVTAPMKRGKKKI